MGSKAMLVAVHDQELAELHVLVAFQRHPVVGPAQPLQVDAETLRELQGDQIAASKQG